VSLAPVRIGDVDHVRTLRFGGVDDWSPGAEEDDLACAGGRLDPVGRPDRELASGDDEHLVVGDDPLIRRAGPVVGEADAHRLAVTRIEDVAEKHLYLTRPVPGLDVLDPEVTNSFGCTCHGPLLLWGFRLVPFQNRHIL
jgi:hypothetical protein